MNIKKNAVIILIVLFCIWNSFFNLKYVVQATWYAQISDIFTIGFIIYLFTEIIKRRSKYSIAFWLSFIVIMFLFSAIWSFVLRGQSIYGSLRAITSLLPLAVFFFLSKYDIGNDSVIRSMIILCALTVFFQIVALVTFPNNVFGFSPHLMEQAESVIEQRGVLRLGIPGQDFIVVMIFLVLTVSKHRKWLYLLLIPLFVMLLLRGTRTPLFVTAAICIVYYLWRIKHKFVTILLGIILFLALHLSYQYLMNPSSDGILANYVQMTSEQLENDDEDIRVEMSRYYFSQFNDNILETIFGNGVPFGKSDYGQEVIRLQDTHSYYIVDVGVTFIYVYFGIVGLIAYAMLLFSVIRTTVDEKYMFAKLYIFYSYLILPTNVSMLSLSPMIFALNLYLVYRGGMIKFHKKYTRSCV